MLTYRTNVLLDKNDHALLSYLAQTENKTISQLIRQAVKATYSSAHDPITKRSQLVQKIKKGWKLLKKPQTPIDYKKLIRHDRKY